MSALSRTRIYAACAAALVAQALQAAPPGSADHADLSYWLSDDGARTEIRTPADWERRRAHIDEGLEEAMGPLPQPAAPTPLEPKVVADESTDSIQRLKVEYHTDSPDATVRAWLLIPKSRLQKRSPAMLCLHQTTAMGKDEPAGLGDRPNMQYALQLAERGYVALAPDYPSLGEYDYDFAGDDYASGSMKAIYDNIRAIDFLQSRDEVDPERIGVIGHSLGGHNAIFTAVFETRIKAVVSSCGFTRFHKYYGGDLTGWSGPRYMPRVAEQYGNDPDKMPFDFPELIAALAPRPFLAVAPMADENFEVSGVRDSVAAAAPIYDLLDAEDQLRAIYPAAGHDFPADARREAYEFLDAALKPSAPRR